LCVLYIFGVKFNSEHKRICCGHNNSPYFSLPREKKRAPHSNFFVNEYDLECFDLRGWIVLIIFF